MHGAHTVFRLCFQPRSAEDEPLFPRPGRLPSRQPYVCGRYEYIFNGLYNSMREHYTAGETNYSHGING